MTLPERAQALESFGLSNRQAQFVALVALHGGFCVRRQYLTFAGLRYGKNVRDFLDSLVERLLAERMTLRADRGHIYHLQARGIYRALGQDENRNRRQASPALIARKLMVLDYVLAHSDVEWLATEQEKVALFAERFGVPKADLPHRTYVSARPDGPSTTRYFTHKLPIAVVGEPPVAYFVFLATDQTGTTFEQFLHDHARLFARLPIWTVVAIGVSRAVLTACESAFHRNVRPLTSSFAVRRDDQSWYFEARRALEAGEAARFSVADIDRFRRLRDSLSEPSVEQQYRDWLAQSCAVAAAANAPGEPQQPTKGRFLSELLRFDYSQFGSLPGVA